jgi:hyperosmotically inducible periplasmic protein
MHPVREESTMDKIIVCLCALAIGACASNEAAGRPAATAATEPAPSTQTRRAEDMPRPAAPGQTNDVEPVHPANVTGPASDNTRLNKRDQADPDSNRTPVDQSNAKSDIEITKEIRQAVVGDGALSFDAKNVKIVTESGHVKLRGTVASGAERSTVESYARQVAGAGHVDNQLDVKN